jgi:hypothetical protein
VDNLRWKSSSFSFTNEGDQFKRLADIKGHCQDFYHKDTTYEVLCTPLLAHFRDPNLKTMC